MTDIFAAIVYVLCFVTSLVCAWLLGRSYRHGRTRLLLWSSICFVLLAANNLALVLDLVVFPSLDLRLASWRSRAARTREAHFARRRPDLRH